MTMVANGTTMMTTMETRTGDDRKGQGPDFVPNGTLFPNPDGASSTYSTTDHGIDLTGPFFQSLGTNGRQQHVPPTE